MDAATRPLVRERAGNVCEYCLLPQEAIRFAAFHVEHITAKQHRGDDDPSNLALSCHHCNAHKGPNHLTGIDPDTGQIVPLFHPVRDAWPEHFRHVGALIEGLTPTGRATIHVLAMNEPDWVELRADFEA
jgi:hypothetical protein